MNHTPPPPFDREYAERVAAAVRAGIERGPEAARPNIVAFRRFDRSKLNGLAALLVRPGGVTDRDYNMVTRGIELEVFDHVHGDVWITTVNLDDLASGRAADAIRETLALDLPAVVGDLDALRAASVTPPPA